MLFRFLHPCNSFASRKVVTFGHVLNTLQNLGEVNIKISMHVSDVQEAGGILFRREQPVCFCLDPLKDDKKKKASQHFTLKSFRCISHSSFVTFQLLLFYCA